MDTTTIIIILIAVIGISILLFFVLREVNLWYWKINERIELQRKTNYLLKKLVDQNEVKNITDTNTPPPPPPPPEQDLNDPVVMEELMKKLNKKT